MFYDTARNDHGLPRDPFKACVTPRPIGWVSTVSAEGIANLAPYSFFNAIASAPPMVMIGSNGRQPARAGAADPKDTVANIRATGVFVVNVATWDLRDAMNASSAPLPPEEDEFAAAGVTAEAGRLVAAPRVAESPISMECRLERLIDDLPADDASQPNILVIGRVVGIHIAEAVLTDGRVDPARLKPLARMGYRDYACADRVVQMTRPGGGDRLAGL